MSDDKYKNNARKQAEHILLPVMQNNQAVKTTVVLNQFSGEVTQLQFAVWISQKRLYGGFREEERKA